MHKEVKLTWRWLGSRNRFLCSRISRDTHRIILPPKLQRRGKLRRGYRKHVRSTTLLNTLVCAVLRLEVQVRGPVVGEILRELAGCAGCGVRDVTGGHGDVEAVSSDDLVDVGRGDLARVDEGVKTVDDDLGAPESQHGHATLATVVGRRFGERHEGEEAGPMHFDGGLMSSSS